MVQLAQKDTDHIEAYDLFLKGWEHYLRWTPEDFFKAIPYFEKAVHIDSNYGRAYAALAATYWHGSINYWGLSQYGVSIEEGFTLAREYLEKALRKPTSLAHYLASEMNLRQYQWREARLEVERAIALEPNNAVINLQMGRVLTLIGNPRKGLDFIRKAMRQDPHYPARALYLQGLAHFGMADFEKAISFLEKSYQLNPEMLETARILTATYALLDHDEDTRRLVSKLHSEFPNQWLLSWNVRLFPFKAPQIVDKFVVGYLKSGLPRSPPYTYYKIFDKYRLTADQIRKLMFGRKVVGLEVGVGTGGLFERSLDGQANFRGFITGSDNGKSWIEKDLLCDQWEERFGGHKICYPVFRNPEGTPENKDEYLIIYTWGFFTFSTLN